jgi:hypothetical protein
MFTPEPEPPRWTEQAQAADPASASAATPPLAATPDLTAEPASAPPTPPPLNQFGLPVAPGGAELSPDQADARAAQTFSHSGTGYSSRVDEVNALGRVSMEHNSYGHYALGLSGAAVLLTILMFVLGGIPMWLILVLAVPGVYYGVRGWNAAARSFATNGRVALTGAILGVLAVLAIPVYFLVVAARVVAIIEGVTP